MQIKNPFSKWVHIWKMISVFYSYFPQHSYVPELTWQNKGICEKIKGSSVSQVNRGYHVPLDQRKRWDSRVEGNGMSSTPRLA